MARRGHGEGNIYKREDGRWEARITLADGKRRSFYAKTRKEVQERLTAALRDQQQGILATGPNQTVKQFLDRWQEDVLRHTVRPSTFQSYCREIRLHIVPIIGKQPLQKLSAQHLQALYSTNLAAGLSPRTVQYEHAILHRALEQALRWNLIARNPADLVDPPRPSRHDMTVLTPTQIGQLLEATKEDRLHALYVLAVSTGLRSGELLGLAWDCVDFDRATIQVRQQLARIRGEGFKFSEPKTAKGRRSVALPGFAVEALRQHRKAQLEERLLAGPDWDEHGLVFSNHCGRPMERQNLLRRSFVPLLERAGLPRIRFHDLRHSAATLLLSQGVHPKVVQERLGHSTIGVTLDIYSHVLPDMQREAAGKLDAFFAVNK